MGFRPLGEIEPRPLGDTLLRPCARTLVVSTPYTGSQPRGSEGERGRVGLGGGVGTRRVEGVGEGGGITDDE